MEKPIHKKLLILNEKTIVADGYDFETYQEAVDEMFAVCDCPKDKDGMYYGKAEDLAGVSSVLVHDREWFKLKHIEKGVSYTLDKITGEYYFDGDMIEAILQYFPEKRVELL